MAQPEQDFLDARQQFLDNADWEENNDLVKAGLFATAIKKLLIYPERAAHGGGGGESYGNNHDVLIQLLTTTTTFIETNDPSAGTGGAICYEFPGGFRG